MLLGSIGLTLVEFLQKVIEAFSLMKKELSGLLKYGGSRNWYFRFYDSEGKRRTITLGTDDLAVALQKKRAILGGQLVSTGQMTRVDAKLVGIYKVIDDYLKNAQSRRKKPMRERTAKKQGAVLLKFVKDSGIESVYDITRGLPEGWVAKLEKEGKSADTLHTYARDLNTFLRFLVKHRHVIPDLLDDFEIPERGAVGRKNWLKHSEVNRIIAAVPKNPDLTFVLYCGFHAGLRKNEIVNAKVGWFDLGAGLIHVQNDPKSGFILKDKDNRSIQISKPFNEFLCKFLSDRDPGEYALRPAKVQGKWVYRYDFSRAWKSHMKRCGVTCTIHDARRSFASNLLSGGENIYVVAKWLGDGVQVVERSYGHLAPSAGNINRLTAKVA
jgi:integrase